MQTITTKASDIQRKWLVVDAQDQVIGRLASNVAQYLRGKHKPIFAPYLDTGDYVIVINAEKARFTGNKDLVKEYQRYSGYPGGLKRIPYARMKQETPEHIIEHAVKGMLPKNKLGRKMFKKLFVYAGSEHPHSAQKPEKLEL